MNNKPSIYSLEMCEGMWLHYDQESQRIDISIEHMAFLLTKLDHWEREFVSAHEKAYPLADLMKIFFVGHG